MVCCNKIYFNSTFLICLIIIAITTTVNIVIDPPKTILGTKPKNVAAIPLSKAPNSFDELTKIELTDETRPFRFSGVLICKILCLITIETASKAPPNNKIPKHKYRFWLRPKDMIHTPNIASAISNFGPTFPFNKLGIMDKKNIIIIEPIPCADRKNPKASEP